MLEEYVQNLIALYQKDLEDYQELLQKMQAYHNFLNSTGDTEEDRDIFQQKLEQFAAYRGQIFENLQQRAKQAKELEAEISAQLAQLGTSLEIRTLETHLPATLYSELLNLAELLRQQMAAVLALDEKIIPLLNQELNVIKAELHRLQGSKKTKNVYEQTGQREARFIDKIK
jgi:hypothetical protein